jgi:hypothetical protein
MSDNNFEADIQYITSSLAKFFVCLAVTVSGLNLFMILACSFLHIEITFYQRLGISRDTYEIISVAAFAIFSLVYGIIRLYEDDAQQ